MRARRTGNVELPASPGLCFFFVLRRSMGVLSMERKAAAFFWSSLLSAASSKADFSALPSMQMLARPAWIACSMQPGAREVGYRILWPVRGEQERMQKKVPR